MWAARKKHAESAVGLLSPLRPAGPTTTYIHTRRVFHVGQATVGSLKLRSL